MTILIIKFNLIWNLLKASFLYSFFENTSPKYKKQQKHTASALSTTTTTRIGRQVLATAVSVEEKTNVKFQEIGGIPFNFMSLCMNIVVPVENCSISVVHHENHLTTHFRVDQLFVGWMYAIVCVCEWACIFLILIFIGETIKHWVFRFNCLLSSTDLFHYVWSFNSISFKNQTCHNGNYANINTFIYLYIYMFYENLRIYIDENL